MINPQQAWEYIIPKARIYAQAQKVIYSPEQEVVYKIESVDDCIRVSGERRQGNIAIGYRLFRGMIDRLNAANGYILRREMYYVVPYHTVVVELLSPRLRFVENNRFIQETQEPYNDVITININEPATNLRDDDLTRIQIWVTARINQSTFRRELMRIYKGRCCVTGCGISATLHACHIVPHAEKGNNQIGNGILLRADIHELFDNNLIGIEPETLAIRISDSILDTEYKDLNGIDLKAGVNGKYLNRDIVKAKWELFLEKNPLINATTPPFNS